MHQCLNCRSSLTVTKLHCETCRISYAGSFSLPRLARLAPAQQQLAEQLVLAAGNLKLVAGALGVSYPTLRKRLDELIDALRALRAADSEQADALLEAVEAGDMVPETAERLIKELQAAL